MKKLLAIICAAALVLSLGTAAFAEEASEEQEPVALENWAYAGITLDNEDYGIASVYYVKDYFAQEGIINPLTVEPYTEEELTAIKDGAVVGAEGYVTNVPTDAVIGISVYGTEGAICWFDEENAKAVLSNADALILKAEDREVVNGDGEKIAEALPALKDWAYAGITLNNQDYGISSVYYVEAYYQDILNGKLETVNPITVAPYTSAEILAILSGAVESGEGYVSGAPENAAIGLGVFDSDVVYWFDAEKAAVILSSADPMVLNAENGEVSNMSGEVIATAIA